jgi:hypothetical protein
MKAQTRCNMGKGRGGRGPGGQGVSKDTMRKAVDLSGIGNKKKLTAEEVMAFSRSGLSRLMQGYSGLLNQVQALQVEQSRAIVRYRVLEKVLITTNLIASEELDKLMQEEQVAMISEHIEITRYLRLPEEDAVLLAKSKGVPDALCDPKMLTEPLTEEELASLVKRNASVAMIEAKKAAAAVAEAEAVAKAAEEGASAESPAPEAPAADENPAPTDAAPTQS